MSDLKSNKEKLEELELDYKDLCHWIEEITEEINYKIKTKNQRLIDIKHIEDQIKQLEQEQKCQKI